MDHERNSPDCDDYVVDDMTLAYMTAPHNTHDFVRELTKPDHPAKLRKFKKFPFGKNR